MSTLHYTSAGPHDGPPVLFVGSLGADVTMWEPQTPLAERLAMITVDIRGHGESPTPVGPYRIADLAGDVLALMDALELERAGFVGLSIGGMIGLWLAAHAPERISGLVCLCSAAHPPADGSAFRERADTVRAAGGAQGIADGIVAKWLTPDYAAAHPEQRARLVAMLAAVDPEGYASCAEAVADFDIRDQLAGIRVPTRVVSGAQDEALAPPLQQEIAEAIPGARYVRLDPGAHLVSIEQAAAVNHLIEEHLG